MRFADPWWLLGLLLIPLLSWLRGRLGTESAFVYSSVGLVRGMTQLSQSRAGTFLIRLRWLTLALLFIGLARPQMGHGVAPFRASGIDIVVAVDLSGSMRAEDFELNGERTDRVTVAKDVLTRFIKARTGDRIGLVAFATQAYIAAPPTLDHSFLIRSVDRLDVLRDGMTAIGSALSASLNRLRDLDSKSRIVVLMTDGQNNAGSITPLTAADAAKALNVKVYTIGVGTRGTAPMPVGVNALGEKVYQQMVVDIDEDTLKEISARTGGRYYRADSTDALRSIYDEIDTLEKSEMEVQQYAFFEELMGYFVVPALVLLFLEIILANTVWRKLP